MDDPSKLLDPESNYRNFDIYERVLVCVCVPPIFGVVGIVVVACVDDEKQN